MFWYEVLAIVLLNAASASALLLSDSLGLLGVVIATYLLMVAFFEVLIILINSIISRAKANKK